MTIYTEQWSWGIAIQYPGEKPFLAGRGWRIPGEKYILSQEPQQEFHWKLFPSRAEAREAAKLVQEHLSWASAKVWAVKLHIEVQTV